MGTGEMIRHVKAAYFGLYVFILYMRLYENAKNEVHIYSSTLRTGEKKNIHYKCYINL